MHNSWASLPVLLSLWLEKDERVEKDEMKFTLTLNFNLLFRYRININCIDGQGEDFSREISMESASR